MSKKALAERVECEWCGERLEDEEAADPRRDAGGDLMCDQCWHDEYEFTCAFCENYEHNDHQHDFLVVWQKTTGVEPGVYRTLGSYWTSDMFSMWLHPDQLERVGDIPKGKGGGHYPCGHLCLKCRKPFLKAKRAKAT